MDDLPLLCQHEIDYALATTDKARIRFTSLIQATVELRPPMRPDLCIRVEQIKRLAYSDDANIFFGPFLVNPMSIDESVVGNIKSIRGRWNVKKR